MAKQKKYTPEFKAKVVKDLIESDESVNEISSKYGISSKLTYRWRKELLDNASVVFSQGKALKEKQKIEEEHRKEVDNLNRIIGKTTVERDYLQQCCEKIESWNK